MILVDYRKGSGVDGKGNELLPPIIRQIGVPCEVTNLAYGDACFEGNGPDGPICIGVERKTLHDMLACIDDSRYTAYQKIGMTKLYNKSYLALEGLWTPGNGNGLDGKIIQGYNNGGSWGPLKLRGMGGRPPLYSKLYRYLMSVALSGVIITPSMHVFHTAYNICEMYFYFQKKWNQHTSLLDVQKLAIPDMNEKPSLVRRWASDLTDIGVIYSLEAERMFKTPRALACADETAWLSIKGIGVPTASRIVREINGWRG